VRRIFAAAALLASACATAPPSAPVASAPPAPAPANQIVISENPPSPPAGMQWLYGSGEGGASSLQAYHAFLAYVIAHSDARPRDSVVLAEGSTLDSPAMIPCGERPLAVVLDVDETAIQNVGFEYDDAVHQGRPNDQARWNRWERSGAGMVLPMPGAADALQSIRNHGVTVIFNTNRMADTAAHTEGLLNEAGLGPAVHGETVWLQGDVAPGSAKDPRRRAIAARYCVIAMAGDQLGDFSDLFNDRALAVLERRRLATTPPFSALWGQGWFILSNPVYGSGLRGTITDIFPPGRRWSDPQGDNR
jgi:5'-nucleotidase (lipoprotein e(P4) family)